MIKYGIISNNKDLFESNKYIIIDNFLQYNDAVKIQQEIIESNINNFDRYENPFEKKYTWRDKFNIPLKTNELFESLNSSFFLQELNELTGYNLIEDKSRNWWGIHTFKSGDKLDIHVDAGRHPRNNLKKIITLGLYLSYNWSKENKGDLEFWSGDNSVNNDAKVYEKKISIEPKFNRLIIFENNDYSWHGSPSPCICNNDETRIFMTCSYLTDIDDSKHYNNRQKAFFVKLPNESYDIDKDNLRLQRADPEKYKLVYNIL